MKSNKTISFSDDLIINDDSMEFFKRKIEFYFMIYEKQANEEKN